MNRFVLLLAAWSSMVSALPGGRRAQNRARGDARAQSRSSAMAGDDLASLEQQFRTLPVEARRWLGPLFWLHGDESRQLLEFYVGKVAEGGNGCFTTESRPHVDWLGEGWWRNLGICLAAAKQHGLQMSIFDEKWWPSQAVGGKVPARYAAKRGRRPGEPGAAVSHAADGSPAVARPAVLAARRREPPTAGDLRGQGRRGGQRLFHHRIAAARRLARRRLVARPGHLPGGGQAERPANVDLRREVVAQPGRGRQGARPICRQASGGDGRRVEGPKSWSADGYAGPRHVAAVAGRLAADGRIEADSLVDLAPFIAGDKLSWQVPPGRWKIMHFTHVLAPPLGQGGQFSVDGASKDCVDWFLATVYQPHYDHFGAEFGRTIRGFFYDEPETRGDWGTELRGVLDERKVDWKKAFVAYKFELAGDDQAAARYQYLTAFAETWGRTMYGGIAQWCHRHGVKSMGHFMEHSSLYVNPEFCAGDMMLLQGHSDMGAIDAVFDQFVMGRRVVRDHPTWQTPKLASSVSHAFGKPDDSGHGRDLRRAGPGPDLPRDEVVGRPHAGLGRQLPDPPLVQSPGAVRPRLPALFLQRRLRAPLAAVPRLRRLLLPAESAPERRAARLSRGLALQRQYARRGQGDHAGRTERGAPGRQLRLRLAAHERLPAGRRAGRPRGPPPPGAIPRARRAAGRSHPLRNPGQGEGVLRGGRHRRRLRVPAQQVGHAGAHSGRHCGPGRGDLGPAAAARPDRVQGQPPRRALVLPFAAAQRRRDQGRPGRRRASCPPRWK